MVYFEQIPVGSYKNFCYLIADRATREAVVIDPAWDTEGILRRLRENGFTLRFIINTHAHFDHIEGNQRMVSETGAKILMHEASLAKKDIGEKDGDVLKVGENISLRFIHTPGHSPESMCITLNETALLTGDTLFIGECGRVDLPGGDAGSLYDSFEKIRALSSRLVVYPGHDYGPTRSSSLKDQLETNYTLAKRSKSDFIRFMNEP